MFGTYIASLLDNFASCTQRVLRMQKYRILQGF